MKLTPLTTLNSHKLQTQPRTTMSRTFYAAFLCLQVGVACDLQDKSQFLRRRAALATAVLLVSDVNVGKVTRLTDYGDGAFGPLPAKRKATKMLLLRLFVKIMVYFVYLASLVFGFGYPTYGRPIAIHLVVYLLN